MTGSKEVGRKSFLLRLNPRLHRVLEQWAANDMRSLNSQIEYLLAEAARKAGRWRETEQPQKTSATSHHRIVDD